MKRTIVAMAVLTAIGGGVSWAQEAKTKDEAQAQVDAGMAKSCETARTQVLAKKEICAEEAAKLEPVDCSKKESRKTVDFLALNSSCSTKVRASASKSAKSDKTGTSTKSDKADSSSSAEAESTHCKALDEAGKVVAETDAKGGALSCRGALRSLIRKEQCAPGKKLKLSFVAVVGGKEEKPTSLSITCE
jgi:hypothetical protein